MVSALIQNFALNNAPPDNVLPYHQNCVAMALSRVLGIGVTPTVNLCVDQGWVPNPGAMQYDNAIEAIVTALTLEEQFRNVPWLTSRTRLSNLEDGRYFAVNTGVHPFGGQGVGHAFAIVKKGGWGIAANNSEQTGRPYVNTIQGGHNISVWGPA